MNTSPAPAQLHSRQIKVGGSFTLSLLLALLGLALLLFFWPLGLLCLLCAFFTGSKYRREFVCGSCGNTAAETSRFCPHCHSTFPTAAPITGADKVKAWLVLGAIALPMIAILVWFMWK